MKTRTMTLAFALAAGSLLSASAAYGQEKAEAKTITAQVVDMSCYLAAGLKGADHKMCSEVCAKAGVPLVFLADDGNLYLPVSMSMPSSSFNEKLVGHAEQKVNVTGKVVERGGTRSIAIDKIAAARY